jgi:hypothetical protein
VQRILGADASAVDTEARERDNESESDTYSIPEPGRTPSPVDGHAPSPLSPVRGGDVHPSSNVHARDGHAPAGNIDADTHVHPLPPTPANAHVEGGSGVHVPDMPRTPDSALHSNNDADEDADAEVPDNTEVEGEKQKTQKTEEKKPYCSA